MPEKEEAAMKLWNVVFAGVFLPAYRSRNKLLVFFYQQRR